MKNIAVYSLCVLLLSSCSSQKTTQEELVKLSAEQLYEKAQSHVNSDKNKENIYETLIANYPKSPEAKQARLDLIRTMINQKEYDDALVEIKTFLFIYMGDSEAVKAYRLEGEVYLSQYSMGIESKISGFLVQHDLFFEESLIQVCKKIINEFPQSEEAKWAEKQLKKAEQNTADYFLQIARFYLKKGNKEAARARAQWVVDSRPSLTERVKEAQEIIAMTMLDQPAN